MSLIKLLLLFTSFLPTVLAGACLASHDDICGYFPINADDVEEMVTVCFWDRRKKNYRSFCRRRSKAGHIGRRWRFVACGCCPWKLKPRTRKPMFCRFPQPITCPGSSSCPNNKLTRAYSRICHKSDDVAISTCVNPFQQVNLNSDGDYSYTCGDCNNESASLQVEGYSLARVCDSTPVCGQTKEFWTGEVEERISICYWDHSKQIYTSQCVRRTHATLMFDFRDSFVSCGCCSSDLTSARPAYCDLPPPTKDPTSTPTLTPSMTTMPSSVPSDDPSTFPTTSTQPSSDPSSVPSENPSSVPSESPTLAPTVSNSPTISQIPTITPSKDPSLEPSLVPSEEPTSLLLTTVGDGGLPLEVFPLKLCQGDCDTDSDCEGNLRCFQRKGVEPIIGCFGKGKNRRDYCFEPVDGVLARLGNDGIPENAFPLGMCQGDCDNNSDCQGDLVCVQRDGWEKIPYCDGIGTFGSDYCSRLPVLERMGDNGSPPEAFPLGLCQGECDSDADCEGNLRCYQRMGTEAVPGCRGAGISGHDYCFDYFEGPLVRFGNNGEPSNAFPLGQCQGDCDRDSECEGDLVCMQRDNFESIPNCYGRGTSAADYCSFYGIPLLDTGACNGNCEACSGPCESDSDCKSGLACFERSGIEAVPGCKGEGVSGTNYCYAHDITYVPGQGTVFENGLLLSTGLTSRIIATTGTRVSYDVGGRSTEFFHRRPDGGAVFADTKTGGWVYVSNAESYSAGGVGAINFDSSGRVIGYKRVLSGTHSNCGGGKTFYNTWLTCEEYDNGHIWEVDPWGNKQGRKTIVTKLMGLGMNFESAAYDNRRKRSPFFYFTVDETMGPLVRFRPARDAIDQALATQDFSQLLHSNPGGTARVSYFTITKMYANGTGTFGWSTKLSSGRNSAYNFHRMGEGIDIRNGILYYTTKLDHYLFIIDLDKKTFQRTSTISGAFNSQPDQVARVVSSDEVLYFCEDGGNNCGVHGRDAEGRFLTILQDAGANFGGETTGLAFSPNGMFMYVSFQSPGHIFEIRRTDGLPFQGQRLDIKYHADSNNHPFSRQLNDEHPEDGQSCHIPKRVGNSHDACYADSRE